MSIVIVTVEVSGTTAVSAPAGSSLAGASITLSNGAPAQLIAAAPYTASFADVADGTYTATVQFVDQAGNPLGAATTSGPVTVASPVSIDVPNVVNIALTVQ
jgi:hypothetical protein